MNESEVEEHRIESGEEFLLVTAKVILHNAPYRFQIWLDKYSPLCSSHVDYFGGNFRSLTEYLKALEIFRNQLKTCLFVRPGLAGQRQERSCSVGQCQHHPHH